jgi:hypothetical protein
MANYRISNMDVQESRRAWHAMLDLVGIIGRGGSVPAMAPTIMLRPGEIQHAGPLAIDCSVFCSADVEYAQGYAVSGGLLFTAVGMAIGEAGLARARRDAIAQAQPQWRPVGRMPLFLTNRRLLVMADGRWKTYDLDSLIVLTAHIPIYALDLHYEEENPVRLAGPWSPWLAVAISALCNPDQWPPYYLASYVPPPISANAIFSAPPSQAPPPALPVEIDSDHSE